MADSIVISASELGDKLETICNAYVQEIDKETKSAIQSAANASKENLRNYNTKRGFGLYGKSWRVKSEGTSLLGYTSTLYSTMPGLPHLIEFGHGGPQPAPPHPHMDDAYKAGVQELERRMGI